MQRNDDHLTQEIDIDIQCEEVFDYYSIEELFTFSDGKYEPIIFNDENDE